MTRVTIAIASSGRPSLVRTLLSLDQVQRPRGTAIDIVVADDDPGGAAGRLVAATQLSLPIRVVAVGSRNISTARNACLDAASGDLLAFVDDDEWVAEDWLVRLLAALDDFSADAVVGPVYPRYPGGTPAWVERANPLYADWGRRGSAIATGRTSNVLLRTELVRTHRLRFDPALGRTGGEDTEFFGALAERGGRIVVTDDASVFEQAPPERLQPGYLKLRALRRGQSYARFRNRRAGSRPLVKALFYSGAAVKAAVGLGAAAVLWPLDRAISLRLSQRGWMNAGKLREVLGLPLPEMY